MVLRSFHNNTSIFLGPTAVGVYLHYSVLFQSRDMALYENLSDFFRSLSPQGLNEMKTFAQDGGPDLSDLRGVSRLNSARILQSPFDDDARNPSTLFPERQT